MLMSFNEKSLKNVRQQSNIQDQDLIRLFDANLEKEIATGFPLGNFLCKLRCSYSKKKPKLYKDRCLGIEKRLLKPRSMNRESEVKTPSSLFYWNKMVENYGKNIKYRQ